jgi:hypothetical protein
MKYFWIGLKIMAVLVMGLFVINNNDLVACGGSGSFTSQTVTCTGSAYFGNRNCSWGTTVESHSCVDGSGAGQSGCGYFLDYYGAHCTSDGYSCNAGYGSVGNWHASTCGYSPPSGGCSGNACCTNAGGTCKDVSGGCNGGSFTSGLCKASGATIKCCILNAGGSGGGARNGRCGSYTTDGTIITADMAANPRNYGIAGWCDSAVNWPVPTLQSDGDYSWKCDGLNGGATANCSASGCSPSNGACGSSNGGTFDSPPGSNCNSGTLEWTDSNGSDGHYDWNCNGNSCGSSASCWAKKNSPPTFSSMILGNASFGAVAAEAGNQNQVCQAAFGGSRTINVTINASDPDGAGDINNIQLMWNNIQFTRTSLSNGVAAFVHTFSAGENNPSANVFYTRITDSVGHDTGWVSTGRSLKVWDCNVPISGSIYDGSAALTCPTTGFSTLADKTKLNFTSLVFIRSGVGVNMTVNSSGNSYGPNSLTWGLDGYVPFFNGDIDLTSQTMSSNTNNCNWVINTTGIDPYSASPSIIANFSGVVDQDPWWQLNGGGINSDSKIIDSVPVTCRDASYCRAALGTNGALVSAPVLQNLGIGQSWSYVGSLANINTNYSYFYNQYFVKGGVGVVSVGKTISSVADLGSDPSNSNVYFINGDLSINGDIKTTNFLMMITSGNVTVSPAVKEVDGILVAKSISAGNTSPSQLVFNGSLFANGVVLSRGYTVKSNNNTKPAVVVNYNPQLIFNLPGKIVKALANWQWGN